MDDAVRRAWRRLQAVDPRLVDGLLVLVLTAAVVAEFLHEASSRRPRRELVTRRFGSRWVNGWRTTIRAGVGREASL